MVSQRSVVTVAVATFALHGCGPVVELPQDPVYTIALTPIAATLANVGDTLRFGATARDIDYEVVRRARIVWTSQDTAVATVDSRGLATGRGTGSTTITASVDSVQGSAVLTIAP